MAGVGKYLGLGVEVPGDVLGAVLVDETAHGRSWEFVGARLYKTLDRFYN